MKPAPGVLSAVSPWTGLPSNLYHRWLDTREQCLSLGPPSPGQVTQMLQRWGAGDARALDELFSVIYKELRVLARHYLRSERAQHTLGTVGLVHEAFVRLLANEPIAWRSRAHFYAIAARAMRRVLVEHARKRGGDPSLAPFDETALDVGEARPLDLVALDQALIALAELDAEKTEIVELRFFGGLTNGEIAELKETSLSSVERQWRLARAWLYRALSS